MLPCLSSVTTLHATFAGDVNACADAGCTALEVWLTKLEDYLKGGGPWAKPDAIKKLLADRGVKLVGAAYQGGLLLTPGEERRGQFTQLQHRLSLCQDFGIETLIIVPDLAERLAS